MDPMWNDSSFCRDDRNRQFRTLKLKIIVVVVVVVVIVELIERE